MSDTAKTLKAEALDHWLTGLLFALILTALVVLGARHSPIFGPVFAQIENIGNDASIRALRLLEPASDIGREGELRKAHLAPDGYVFIDLDADTCFKLEHDSRCTSRSPASPAAAAHVARAVLSAHPRLLIIDTYLWGFGQPSLVPADVAELVKLVKAHPETPVLAPAPVQGGSEPGHVSIDWDQISPIVRDSPIHFAAAIVWPDGIDGVIRNYPRSVFARLSVNDDMAGDPGETIVPSLPYLAALYSSTAAGQRDQLDCLARDAVTGASPGCHASSALDVEGTESPRMLFSLPPGPRVSFGDDQSGARLRLYRQFSSSEVLVANADAVPELSIDSSIISNKIVLIGTSAATVFDRHPTPIGQLSGATLLLNATRSFIALPAFGESSWAYVVAKESLITIIASIPFYCFWRVNGRLWKEHSAKKIIIFGKRILTISLFLATISVSFLMCFFSVSFFIYFQIVRGTTVDALLPLTVLALDSFAHGSKYIIESMHHAVASRARNA